MGLNCGIVGLPNVGKSTIFQALTSSPAAVENYPFCTIEPNIGVVNVSDPRINTIAQYIKTKKQIPTIVEFVDIAGLVKGASKGEGLGNQFLGHIRQVSAIIHVVRCFEDSDIVHVHGQVNPLSDIETINLELCLADLDTVNKKHEALRKELKSHQKDVQKKAQILKPLLDQLKVALEAGKPARSLPFDRETKEVLESLHLITLKQIFYICNVDEDSIGQENIFVKEVIEYAEKEYAKSLVLCGKIEAEIASLDKEEEREEFLKEVGLEESGLKKLIRGTYNLLGLKTYFTAGEKEVRAWTYRDGMTAPECAGIIHTDFKKGFIKAEVYHYNDLVELKSEQKVREAGRLRQEGKQYFVQDGDIIHFKFNV